jgi:hypothetical protein
MGLADGMAWENEFGIQTKTGRKGTFSDGRKWEICRRHMRKFKTNKFVVFADIEVEEGTIVHEHNERQYNLAYQRITSEALIDDLHNRFILGYFADDKRKFPRWFNKENLISCADENLHTMLEK